jgi:hypothetical protein
MGATRAIDERPMRTALLGGTALAAVAIAAILLWGGGGGRLPAPLPAEPASNSFVIHDAAPASPSPDVAQPAQPSSLDALMQKMRAGAGGTMVVTPSSTASPTAAPASPASTPTSPVVGPASSSSATTTDSVAPPPGTSIPAAPSLAPTPPTPLLPIAAQWTNVTSQGVRWRLARGATGFLLSIDLGGGQVADVHVQPAFLNLDVAAASTRVDYLKATILQNFSSASGTYTFARDGSVSIDR